jgi:hypothetical protein
LTGVREIHREMEAYIGTCLGTNSPHVRVHERRPKHEKLKNVNPPFHGNTSFQKITNALLFVPPLIGLNWWVF